MLNRIRKEITIRLERSESVIKNSKKDLQILKNAQAKKSNNAHLPMTEWGTIQIESSDFNERIEKLENSIKDAENNHKRYLDDLKSFDKNGSLSDHTVKVFLKRFNFLLSNNTVVLKSRQAELTEITRQHEKGITNKDGWHSYNGHNIHSSYFEEWQPQAQEKIDQQVKAVEKLKEIISYLENNK